MWQSPGQIIGCRFVPEVLPCLSSWHDSWGCVLEVEAAEGHLQAFYVIFLQLVAFEDLECLEPIGYGRRGPLSKTAGKTESHHGQNI